MHAELQFGGRRRSIGHYVVLHGLCACARGGGCLRLTFVIVFVTLDVSQQRSASHFISVLHEQAPVASLFLLWGYERKRVKVFCRCTSRLPPRAVSGGLARKAHQLCLGGKSKENAQMTRGCGIGVVSVRLSVPAAAAAAAAPAAAVVVHAGMDG